MATGTQMRAKAVQLLTKFQATSRPISLREVTTTGGNPRLGIGVTTVNTDTLCVPQPAVEMVNTTAIANSGGLLQPGDFNFIFEGGIPEATLRNRQILYGTEVLHIVHLEPYALNGLVVAWNVMARTLTHQT